MWSSVKNPSRPLSKNALSFFLRDVFREAHAKVPEELLGVMKVKAHEIRAVSTSLAFKKNVSLEYFYYRHSGEAVQCLRRII